MESAGAKFPRPRRRDRHHRPAGRHRGLRRGKVVERPFPARTSNDPSDRGRGRGSRGRRGLFLAAASGSRGGAPRFDVVFLAGEGRGIEHIAGGVQRGGDRAMVTNSQEDRPQEARRAEGEDTQRGIPAAGHPEDRAGPHQEPRARRIGDELAQFQTPQQPTPPPRRRRRTRAAEGGSAPRRRTRCRRRPEAPKAGLALKVVSRGRLMHLQAMRVARSSQRPGERSPAARPARAGPPGPARRASRAGASGPTAVSPAAASSPRRSRISLPRGATSRAADRREAGRRSPRGPCSPRSR